VLKPNESKQQQNAYVQDSHLLVRVAEQSMPNFSVDLKNAQTFVDNVASVVLAKEG
jgi:hypothetical protein